MYVYVACNLFDSFQMERHDNATGLMTTSPASTTSSPGIAKAIPPDTLSYSNMHHYASIADPPAPRVINCTSVIFEKPKPDDEQRDILNLDFVKQSSSASKLMLSNKSSNAAHHAEPLTSKQPIAHSFDHAFDTSITFNKSYDISSTKAIEMFNRAATMSFSKTKSFPTSMASDPMNFSKPFPSPPHTIKHDSAELSSLPNRPLSGLLNAYQPPSTLHSSYSLYSLDSKSTHLAYNPHELDAQVQQTPPKHSLYGSERLDQSVNLVNDNRMKPSSELNIPTISSHRYDVSGYDPNIRSAIMHPPTDDNLNANSCYYPPKDHNSSSLYAPNKNVLPQPSQMSPVSTLSPSNPYGMVSR